MIRYLLAAALTAFVAHPSPPAPRVHVIYVSERSPFNASHGDHVVMVMDSADPDATSRCEHSGGVPTFNATSGVLYCNGIDF